MSTEQPRMKPVLIIPKGELSPEDLDRLRGNDFCVVEADNPDAVRFMEPPPQGYTSQEQAAIKLTRFIVNHQSRDCTFLRTSLVDYLARCMIEGTPLSDKAAPQAVKKVKGT